MLSDTLEKIKEDASFVVENSTPHEFYRSEPLFDIDLGHFGPTLNRPVGNVHPGFSFFDTDLGYIIHATGTGTWVDASGMPV